MDGFSHLIYLSIYLPTYLIYKSIYLSIHPSIHLCISTCMLKILNLNPISYSGYVTISIHIYIHIHFIYGLIMLNCKAWNETIVGWHRGNVVVIQSAAGMHFTRWSTPLFFAAVKIEKHCWTKNKCRLTSVFGGHLFLRQSNL